MDTRNIKDIYPLSPMQQGMLFHSLYAPESGVYVEQSSWTLRGALDVSAFEQAWRRVVDRHSVLRTAFLWEDLDEPLQVVYRRVELELEERDWRSFDGSEQQSQLEAFLSQDRERGFGLDEAPLMRLVLIRLDDDAYHFVWSHHHLLLDGWSQPILFQEVFGFYEAFSQEQDLHLPPPRPYRDYIAWLQQQDGAETEAFWRRTLQGFTAPTPLTVEGILKEEGGESDADLVKEGEGYASQRALLLAETMEALQTLARQNQLTLNTLVQGAWALLLSRYSGEEDVVFGATVSGRPPDLPGAETMVGLFINTLPVRVQIEPEATTLEWLKELQVKQSELRQHEHTFLVDVQGWSEVPRDLPLFESLLVFESYPITDAVRGQEHSLHIEGGPSFSRTNYPLLLAVSPGRGMGLEVAYDAQRFGAGTIRRMLIHFQTLLKDIVANLEQPLSALSLLTEAERRQLLVEWNGTEVEYPHDLCVHELFEARVEQTPDAIAVIFADQSTNLQPYQLTYAELNRQANRLAHYLQKLGVGPDALVSICVERSFEMVVGMLGILKAGGAYVPMDPANPPGRLAFMLEDTQVPLLLTQAHLADKLLNLKSPISNLQVICLDTDWELVARESFEDPVSGATPGDLAYVIYTSGSTGRPKGVLLEHRGFCNQVVGWARHFEVKPRDRVLQFLSFGFDGSIVEFFPTLVSGATLHLIPRQMALSLPDLHQLLQEQEITSLAMTPSALAVLPSEDLPSLKTVISGGEKCTREVAARWASDRRFANVYGPTEATVTAAWYDVDEPQDEGANIPIGHPFPNVRLYVLDERFSPVPIGLPGELYIGGVGVARGYLNRPELTTERFIPDPFASPASEGGWEGAGARLYKTGDLVRYLPDGNIEFLGRADFQVKIRGFRVELGEIETVLNRHPMVQTAAVLDREEEPGNPYLAAYIVPEGDNLDLSVLNTYLKEQLPAYMVPVGYVVMDALPLTPSGKINRRALPAPEGRAALETAYVAPRTPVEEGLVDLWTQVLGVERVGVRDDFFDLGGHSLLATRLVSRVREVFQVEVPLRDIFESPTVVDLAERVEAALRAASGLETPPIVPVSRDGALPLSFAQQRLWFLDQLAPDNLFYNIPMAVRLKGRLDVTALEQSVNEIVRRHESLRTTFDTVDGKPVQVIAPELTVPLPVVDLTDLPEVEREEKAHQLVIQEVRRPFDLAQGPLLRARLLWLDEENHIALLTMHHIVSDGWSMEILIREIATLYQAFSASKPSPLPELEVQYADFAHWQREWLQGEVLETQLDYWKQQLGGSPPMLELPTDRPRPAVQTSRGATHSFTLPQDLSERVKALSREEGATLFMTLLAAFQALLYRYTGQEDVSVGTPIANRTRGEIEGLIGFFVNPLVLRTDL
ncbi:MAG: amino acid adenylation domain-containing protein, partial [Chloroflexota bacterium]|nr:amino acid adenylation domain-containing protein [Chloroflexota bacterium]